jgi:ribosomal protein S1
MGEELLVSGVIKRVERFGMLVDIESDHPGFVDPLYIDDSDSYDVGQEIMVYVMYLDEQKGQYILRPVGQTPLVDRLRAKGHKL